MKLTRIAEEEGCENHQPWVEFFHSGVVVMRTRFGGGGRSNFCAVLGERFWCQCATRSGILESEDCRS